MFTLIFPGGMQQNLTSDQAARLLDADRYTVHRWPDHAQLATETYVIVTPFAANWRQMLADAGHDVRERRAVDH